MQHTAAEGAFAFQYEERNTGGTKFPTSIDLSAHHPETGEELGRARYFPPKRRNAPLHIDDVQGHVPGAASALLNEIETRHPGSPTKFLHEVKRNNNNPDKTGHELAHAGDPSDWDTHHSQLTDTIHRGVTLRLPASSARIVNSADASKDDHLAELHDALPTGHSLGMHWTENEHSARLFAHNAVSDARTDIPVVLHAHTPAIKDLETRRDHLYRGGVFPYGDEHSKENEVPLRKGRKVSVTGISWRPDAAHPDADENGWVHHTYPDPVQHTAATDAPFSVWHMAVQEPDQVTEEPVADVSDLPHTCSYCGSQQFDQPEDTGRGLRAVCTACGGAMLRTDTGVWTPAGLGSTHNHPRPDGDPGSGGVGGAANVGVDADRMNDASARHASLEVWAEQLGLFSEPRHSIPVSHVPAPKTFSWDEIGNRHPHVYGDSEIHGEAADGADGPGIGSAANYLAHETPKDPDGESHSVDDLQFHEQYVHPRHIDYSPSGSDNYRVKNAREGYQQHPEKMPPLVLVKRHNVYQVADGHHRAEAADSLNVPVRAYVAHSPYPNTPFRDGEKGPFHRAEPEESRHEAAAHGYQNDPWVMAKPGDKVSCPTCHGAGSYDEDEPKSDAEIAHEGIPPDAPEGDFYRTVTHPCDDCGERGYHERGTDKEEMDSLREAGGPAAHQELRAFAEKHEDEDPHPDGLRQPSCPPECSYLNAEDKAKRQEMIQRYHQQHTANSEVPWCAHLYHGNCTYPGDKLPNGTILGIPQDRGPCPWKHSASMQAACPISEPGPMAVQFREASLHEAAWRDVQAKAKRIRKAGGVNIIVASTDGVAGEVQGDTHIYETAITWVPGTSRTAAWSCGCKWGAYAWGPTWDGRPCSHVLAMRFEAQSRSMYGREIDVDEKRPQWLQPQTSVVVQYERPSEDHPQGRDLTRRAVPPGNMRSTWDARSRTRRSSLHSPDEINALVAQAFAEAKDRLDQDQDPADVVEHLITAGIPHANAQNIVLAARGRTALLKVARKCPECGAELNSDDNRCDDCGAVLEQRSVTHSASWGDDEQRCPHCGGYIGPAAFKAGHCPHCGHALAHKTGVLGAKGSHYYLRFDKWPKDERSYCSAGGYREDGVSVYDMHQGHPVVPGMDSGFGPEGNDTHDELQGRIRDWKRGVHPAYVVRGDHVSFGYDEEPLLNNVKRVRTLNPDEHDLDPVWHSQIAKEDPEGHGFGKTGAVDYPGYGGSQGPFEDDYSEPHVYARDIHSGAGNCVCGGGLGDPVHVEAAPGVEVPEHQRTTAYLDQKHRPHRTEDARKNAPKFGEDVPNWGLTLVDCPQCGGRSGCGHCGGTGQVIGLDGTTGNPTPDQNPSAGKNLREDGLSDTSSLRPEFAAKAPEGPSVAGVALKAADTGRILMLQRGLEDEKDPARGTWEMPGGHVESGDRHTLDTAVREWQEEVGQPFPEGGVVTHAWTSPNGVYQGHVVVIPKERDLVMHNGRVVPNPDDPKGDKAEQAAWWHPDHARKNPALRPELKNGTPWNKIKEAGSDAGMKVEALLREGAAADALYSLEEAQPVTPPPHSNSENPVSSGFLTTQDPQSWSEVTHNPNHLAPADSLDSPLAMFHSVPEGALPSTDGGDLEDSTQGTNDDFRDQTGDNDSLDGTSDTIPDTEMEGSPMEPLGGMASKRSVAEIVEQFQRTAGAQALQNGSGGSDVGFSDGEIAAKARERLAGLSKTAMANFTFSEQQELITEGKGARARNFGDLSLGGTHYSALQDAIDAAGVSDDDLLIL